MIVRLDSLIDTVKGFSQDEQQPKIKKVLEKSPLEGSVVLYMHYEDLLYKLTQVVKLGSEYIKQSRENLLHIDSCCICQEHFDPARTKKRISCGHDQFHTVCINKWLDLSRKCPICKQLVDV